MYELYFGVVIPMVLLGLTFWQMYKLVKQTGWLRVWKFLLMISVLTFIGRTFLLLQFIAVDSVSEDISNILIDLADVFIILTIWELRRLLRRWPK